MTPTTNVSAMVSHGTVVSSHKFWVNNPSEASAIVTMQIERDDAAPRGWARRGQAAHDDAGQKREYPQHEFGRAMQHGTRQQNFPSAMACNSVEEMRAPSGVG